MNISTKKYFFAGLLSILALLYMLPCLNTDNSWQSIATKDINFITSTLKENHPGMYNTLDPEFCILLEQADNDASRNVASISTINDYDAVLTAYGRHFNDAHLGILTKATPRKPLNIHHRSFALSQITPTTTWITLPTFDPTHEQQVDVNRIISKLSEHRDNDLIIFDIRGNSGGNSLWGTKIISALFGEQYAEQKINELNRQVSIDWRASCDNINHVAQIIDKITNDFGNDHPEVRSFRAIYDGMIAAQQNNIPFYNERNISNNAHQQESTLKNLCNAKIIVLIDNRCVSAGLDFIDELKAMGNSITLVGETTKADSVYMEVRGIQLPSTLGKLFFPIKVYRNRVRGHNQPYYPDIELREDLNDDEIFNVIQQQLSTKSSLTSFA